MRYQINETKMFYDMADGQAIVINFETGMYYGMSSLGSAVLDRLVRGIDIETVADELAARKEAPSNLGEMLQSFIEELRQKEILVPASEEQGSEQPPLLAFEEESFTDGWLLEVAEYAEAQDLILADPIHDVDVDMGWPIMKDA